MDRAQGFPKIVAAVADCLGLDTNQITSTSRLIDDLGADSLDFMDLMFSLERIFQVKIREGEMDFLAWLDLSDPAVMKEGVITPETIVHLKTWLPEIDNIEDQANIAPAELFGLITVETLWRVVQRQLAQPQLLEA